MPTYRLTLIDPPNGYIEHTDRAALKLAAQIECNCLLTLDAKGRLIDSVGKLRGLVRSKSTTSGPSGKRSALPRIEFFAANKAAYERAAEAAGLTLSAWLVEAAESKLAP